MSQEAQATAPGAAVQAQAQAPLEAESSSDIDSAFGEGGDDFSNFSTSVTSGIRNYQYENGRRYHAYRAGEYTLPNDEPEQDRLDLLHHIFKLLLGGGLHLAPIGGRPGRVLDMGTGTGIWAMDFADMFPSAEVIGNDISPIQPSWVPPNCKFVVDDLEAEWVYPSNAKFDYIHGRGLAGSIGDWKKFYKQCYDNLKPGGWLEMHEYACSLLSDDDTLKNAKWATEWCELLDQASSQFGKRLDVSHLHGQWLREAGFQGVEDKPYKVPIGAWPKDPDLKQIGRYELLQMFDAADSFTLGFFTRVLGFSVEKTQTIIEGVKQDLKNPRHHIYSYFHFVYGRKPES